MKCYQMYVGGEWIDATNHQVEQVISPSTEEVIAEIQNADEGDAERILEVAKQA
ncbi:aldehyde dehydrogenase, partial [Vibrio splendidus]